MVPREAKGNTMKRKEWGVGLNLKALFIQGLLSRATLFDVRGSDKNDHMWGAFTQFRMKTTF